LCPGLDLVISNEIKCDAREWGKQVVNELGKGDTIAEQGRGVIATLCGRIN